MHILCLTQWFTPEPESSRGLPFAKWLQGRGHRVTVLTGFPNYPSGKLYPGYRLRLRQWEEIEGVRVLRVPLYPNHDRSALKRALNYLSFAGSAALIGLPSIGKVDVIYAMATPPTVGLPPFLKQLFSNVPYLFNVTDIWPEAVVDSGMVSSSLAQRAVSGILKATCRLVYGGARFVTAISKGYKRMLVESGLHEKRVHAVYNWVDEELFRPIPRDPAVMRQLSLEGHFNFIYAGNFGPFQGLHVVLRAAALLRDIPDIRVVLVGAGQLEEDLRAQARELKLPNVRFINRINQREMPAVYSAADVLLIHLLDRPFLRATVPSKTQISLATGRPVLMAAEGESAEIVREAGAGMVCKPEDEFALADGMKRLYRAPTSERDAMGRCAREYYLSKMSQDVGARRIEDLFLEAAG
jgi:colanic acid biosynthesis glycosyl transferase WcaI